MSWSENMPKTRHSQHEVSLQRLDGLTSAYSGQQSNALGLESKDIPDDYITASSTATDSSTNFARLNCKRGAWCSSLTAVNPYLQVDLGSLHDVTGVATQGVGNTGADRFVKVYKLQFSVDGDKWEYYQEGKTYNQELQGNKDSKTVVKRNLVKPVCARFVRFYPVSWYGKPCMRVEVYGAHAKKATYETNVKISDVHGNGVNGSPVLQFSIQLFGENGYTSKLPLEIEATDVNKQEMDFERKIMAANIGWIKHLKLSYDVGSESESQTSSPTLIQKFKRLSSSSSSNGDFANGESGFFVDDITIDVKETGQHFTFTCKQWLLQRQTAFSPGHHRRSRMLSEDKHLIENEDFEHLLRQEAESTDHWKTLKREIGIHSFRREPTPTESTPLTKTTFAIDGIPYNDAVRLFTDWSLRVRWDQTFRTVVVLQEDIDSKVVYCCLKMPILYRPWEIVLSCADRPFSTPEPHHVISWCSTEHSSVAESDKSTLGRIHVRLSGMVIRPIGDGMTSCKVTLLTRMRTGHHSTPRPVKNSYLNGNPTQWLNQLKEYYLEHGLNETKENGIDEVFETEKLLTGN
ncbi:uncharacterized protein LOC110231793 isoform X2 [Exaiptasia diaphana]|uniref:Uncharacterized protein n=1 Tax=Exaiptasia diaphana TaxID=2652724 RepID=A0A913WQC6_EXADI|nr:uncharacterized protein LOC110231793 isoform X2 [Exaiptasia diaphana]